MRAKIASIHDQCVSSTLSRYMNIFVSTWALLAGGLICALPMIYYRVKEHTELADEAVYVVSSPYPCCPPKTNPIFSQCAYGRSRTCARCRGSSQKDVDVWGCSFCFLTAFDDNGLCKELQCTRFDEVFVLLVWVWNGILEI